MQANSDDPVIYEPHTRHASWHYDGRVNVTAVDCMRESEKLSVILQSLPSIESDFLTRRDQFYTPPADKVQPCRNSVQTVLDELDTPICQIEADVKDEAAAASVKYCPPCYE